MFRAFAEMLTLASLPVWLFTIAYTFVWRAWHFLPSFLIASLLVVPMLGLAIVCEHRDAAASGRATRSFFPSREGFASFLFVTTLSVVGCGYFIAFSATVLHLPGGDAWPLAWIRLAFFGVAILLAWQLHYWTTIVSRRWGTGYVYDEWLESLGKPVSWNAARGFLLSELPAMLLVVLLIASLAVVWYGIDWVAPYLDDKITRGSRAAKLQLQFRWLIRHPNTVNLFAAANALVSTAVLLWKAVARSHQENELSHE